MRIGIVTTWFERGAAYVSKQFEEILEQEHDVYIYARGGESYAIGDPKWDKDNVWWGKRIISPIHGTYIDKKDFIKWIKKTDVDLIIFNEQQWFLPLIWCKELNIKTLAYIDYYTNATIPLFDIYDGLICNTKRHHSAFIKHKNAMYLPWGTNLNVYKPTDTDLVGKDYVTYFHSAGMSGYRKGTDLFIKAYLQSNQKGRMVIHTQKDLKAQFPELASDIDRLIEEDKLELITGTVTAPGLYYKGDVYVYPSRLDGIGLTIAESLAAGLGCIVPDNGPMNEFVSSECGFTVSIERFYCREDGYYWPMCEIKTECLADIINHLDANHELVKQLKLDARKYAEYNLSQAQNFKVLNKIVKQVAFTPISDSLKQKILRYNNNGLGKYENFIIKTYPFIKSIKKVLGL